MSDDLVPTQNDAPMALSIESVRNIMRRGLEIPTDITNRALRVLNETLDATETKFFSFKGRVVSRETVVDHASRLSAADKVATIAGLYDKNPQEQGSEMGVGISVDPHTGIVRIIHARRDSLPQHTRQALPQRVHTGTQGVPDQVWDILSDDTKREKRVVLDELVD